MAFEELKENLDQAEARVRSYVRLSTDYYQLKGFKIMMHGIVAFSKVLLVGTIGILALFFLSLAASFGIGQILDNTFYGFLCVGGFYTLAGILAYVFRRKLNKPIIRKFSAYYFDES